MFKNNKIYIIEIMVRIMQIRLVYRLIVGNYVILLKSFTNISLDDQNIINNK